jgi:uncharacterized protein (DUF488 family)
VTMINQVQNTVFTIGHSTRSTEDFIELIKNHWITRVVDVRTIPRSWHNPQFNKNILPDALEKVGISYQHIAGLGGLRHARKDSPNLGWRNASFRGFADYMQTPEFTDNLEALIKLSQKEIIVLMCAETVPWRCHRSLIADALLIRGISVEHIMSATSLKPHTLTPWAKVQGNVITYPVPDTFQEPSTRQLKFL